MVLAVAVLYAAVWNCRVLPQKEALLVRSESVLNEAADSDRCIIIEGTIQKCSRTDHGRWFQADKIVLLGEKQIILPQSHRVIFDLREEKEALQIGERVQLSGELALFEPAGNPGQFDSRSYYRRENVAGQLKNVRILKETGEVSAIRSFLQQWRERLDDSCLRILEEESARTLAAVAFGEKAWMVPEVKTQYQESGIAHIVSISGLHISMLGMGLYRALRHIIPWIPGAAVLSAAGMGFFVLMTGGSVSAQRAAWMFGLWLVAQIFGRKYDGKSALAFAGGFLLISDPQNLFDASFLLSFSALFCLLFLVPEFLRGIGQKQGMLRGSALVSGLMLWFGMLPVTLWFFFQTPVYAIFLNLLVVSLMPFVMGNGVAGAVVGLFSRPAGVFLGAPAGYLLQLFRCLCEAVSYLPGALQIWGRPTIAKILLYYGNLLITVAAAKRIRNVKGRVVLWTMCILLGIGIVQGTPPKQVEILCMDVGQGDGTLLRMPTGENCLIDSGSSSEKNIWKGIDQTLRYYGADTLDYVFLSHADADHINGIEQYLSAYACNLTGKNRHGITLKALVLPPTAEKGDFRKLRQLCAKNGIQIFSMEAGSQILEGRKSKWSFSCLAPNTKTLSGDKNEDSMVLLFQYGKFRMLFTGDLEGTAEKQMAKTNRKALKADVLKVGHHGSKNGSSEEFLAEVAPQAAVISCGAKNNYGHPAEETVTRLKKIGSEIYITAEDGAILICTDGRHYVLSGYVALAKSTGF